ncbi:MAG: class I SAM-dependent methyltransferase [Cyanobacteria bacterium SZAS LIN-3]|nr:class I SAM-dependent methyltransferase [Cyanobacteria bacterium SZAS LIN-3]MBS2007102.1 class I SAM-dependent methyltransferase [Cyanobacteria bacterium SZAS TMP-1]
MQAENRQEKNACQSPQAQVQSAYEGNIEFWERAWNMVKVPYTQLPSLSYIPRIPEVLQTKNVKRVLDLGCGSGWLSVYLARQGFEVVGIDVSAQAISLAETWALQEDLKIAFSVGDIADLPYEAGSFDAIVANSIFEHFPLESARAMANRVHEILTDDGIFIGCFDEVGGGPGEYFSLEDGTHVYTDKARKGMLLRRYSAEELASLFGHFKTMTSEPVDAGSTFLVASKS